MVVLVLVVVVVAGVCMHACNKRHILFSRNCNLCKLEKPQNHYKNHGEEFSGDVIVCRGEGGGGVVVGVGGIPKPVENQTSLKSPLFFSPSKIYLFI